MTEPRPGDDASRRVSFDDEPLIVVDEENRVLGHRSKAECHEGEGILHRAFSVFLFDDEGRVLLQQRADGKRLWPLYWSNSVCSHPRRGETEGDAARRRVEEELGVGASLEFVYRFQYHARYDDHGSESELCAVYVGRAEGPVRPNETEIASWRWVTPPELDRWVAREPEAFTPWFRMEWSRLRGDLADRVAAWLPR